MWLAGLRSFLAGSRAQGQCWSGFLGESLSFFSLFFFFPPAHRVGVNGPQSLCVSNTNFMMPTSQRNRQFKVSLSSASYFLFLNKITWAGSAGGGRTFRVQQLLLLLLLLSPESLGSNAGAR